MLYRIGLFYCAAPLSGAFGGLLATGLAKINTGGYDGPYRSGNVWLVTNMRTGWPWIFFIEGVITVCFGILCFVFMPNTPADAKFFTEEERSMAQARMMHDAHGSTKHSDVNNEKFDWHWVRMALLSPNTMFCSLAWFFLLVPLYVRLRR
jgi:sugar phosphate permease